MFRRLLCCFFFIPCALFAQDEEILRSDKVTVAAIDQAGRTLRTGIGFLYNETTVICSYSDIRGASGVRIEWSSSSAEANRVISYSESMDLAILSTGQEIPVLTPISSSTTLALGDKVFYWTQPKDKIWQLTQGAVHQILDTGKGYSLILIESASYTTRSTPLYNSAMKIVGWLQGKRAITMETISELAEKAVGKMTVRELNQLSALSWKFSKPSANEAEPSGQSSASALKKVSGPSTYPFKLNVPADWEAKISDDTGKFLLRYEHAGVCVEVRATPLGSGDLLSSLEEIENSVFANFLRAELNPYSADYLTGFRASYEDSDPVHPYSLHVFYTSASQNIYLLSICYPEKMEQELQPLVEQIFSSFRM